MFRYFVFDFQYVFDVQVYLYTYNSYVALGKKQSDDVCNIITVIIYNVYEWWTFFILFY